MINTPFLWNSWDIKKNVGDCICEKNFSQISLDLKKDVRQPYLIAGIPAYPHPQEKNQRCKIYSDGIFRL